MSRPIAVEKNNSLQSICAACVLGIAPGLLKGTKFLRKQLVKQYHLPCFLSSNPIILSKDVYHCRLSDIHQAKDWVKKWNSQVRPNTQFKSVSRLSKPRLDLGADYYWKQCSTWSGGNWNSKSLCVQGLAYISRQN